MSSYNKGKVTKKNNTQLKWFNNVAKSLGYATSDLVTELVPASSEFVKSNYEATTEMINDMRQNRASGKRLSTQLGNLEQVKIGQTALRNVLDDIKSGNIYNKEREQSYFDSDIDDAGSDMFGNDFGDGDFSFGDEFDSDDDFSDVEIDDSDPNVTNVKKVNVQNVNNNLERSVNMLPLAKAMHNQTNAVVTTIQGTSQVQTALTGEFMMMYNNMSSTTIGGLTAINDNLSLLVNFQNDSMSKYIGASIKYYEDHLKKVDDSLDILKQGFSGKLNEDTTRKQSKDGGIDPFLGNGGLNFKEYTNLVKSNIREYAEGNDMLSAFSMFWKDTDTLKEMASNPLKYALTPILKSTIPKSLKNKLGDMDETFSNFFPALLNRVAATKDSDNPMVQMINTIFGVNPKVKRKVDLGNYNKGVIGFDGESKKALVEVIPTYLRKIESALSGSEEKIYDYSTGTFKSAKKLKADYDEEVLRTKTSGYGTFKSEFKEIAKSFNIGSEEELKTFYEEVDKYLVKMTDTGKAINPLKQMLPNGNIIDELTDNGLFVGMDDMREVFGKIYKMLPEKVKSELMGTGLTNSMARVNKFNKGLEENPNKLGYAALNHGFGINELFEEKNEKLVLKRGSLLTGPVDKHGLGQLDYLRDIRQILSRGIVTFPQFNGSGTSQGVNIDGVENFINPNQEFLDMVNSGTNTSSARRRSNGRRNVNRNTQPNGGKNAYAVSDFYELNNLPEELLHDEINRRRNTDNSPTGFKSSGLYKFLDKREKLHGLRDVLTNVVGKPIKFLENAAEATEGLMSTILHGTEEEINITEAYENFKTKLFGDMPEGENPTLKFEGVLPPKVAQFLSENKMQLKVGGGLGLLGSFFLPGGPIAGTILGIGTGLATKSDWFQQFLYGENFKDEKDWKSGFFGKALNKFGGKLEDWGIDPKYSAFLSAGGAGLGLMSSFFLPFGPVGGALLGLAGGISASSDKFQTWLFGEKGEDDKRRGGFLTKFTNWFDVNVKDELMVKMSKIGISISDFFHESISEPFLDAIGPLRHMFEDVADKTKEMFHRGWETINENVFKVFHENVAKPFGETLEKFVLDPLKGFMSKTLSFAGKVIGGVLSAPFKALGFISKKVDARNEKNALAEEKQNRWDQDVLEMKEKFINKEISFADLKKFITNRGNLKGSEKADFLKEVLPYRDRAAEDKEKRAEKHLEKKNKRIQRLNERMSANQEKKDFAIEHDYRYTSQEQIDLEREQIELFRAAQAQGEQSVTALQNINNIIDSIGDQNIDQVDMLKQIRDLIAHGPQAVFNAAREKIKTVTTRTPEQTNEVQRRTLRNNPTLRAFGQRTIEGSHASGLDNVPRDGYIAELHEGEMVIPAHQANILRRQAGVKTQKASKVKGPLNGSNDVVNSLDKRLIGTKNDYIKRIARDTRIIAAEVKGQLDGVGRNVYKTRKLLQNVFGIDDKDIAGKGNKERQGFFGKLRHALYKPFDFIKDTLYNVIMKPINWVQEKIENITEWVGNAFTKMKDFGKSIIKGGVALAKTIGNTALKVIVALKVANGLVDVGTVVGKMFVKGAGRIVSDIYGGAKFLVTNAFKGVFKGFETIGKVALATADTIGHAANFIGNAIVDITKGMYTVTKDILKTLYGGIKGVFKGAIGIAKGAFNVVKGAVSGVARGAGFVFNKLFNKDAIVGGVKKVQIVGGRLDSIGSIEKPVEISNTTINNIVNEYGNKTLDVNVKSLPSEKNGSNLRPLVDKSAPAKSNVIQFPGLQNQIPGQDKLNKAAEKKQKAEENKKKQEEEKVKNKEHTTRKTANFMKKENEEKKDKAEFRQYTEVMAKSAVATAETSIEQYKFWNGIFGKKGKVSRFLEGFGKLFSFLKDGLGNLGKFFGGIGLGRATMSLLKSFAPFIVPLGIGIKKALDVKKNLKNGADGIIPALLGQGDETRKDADGSYIYDGDFVEGAGKYFARPQTRKNISKLGLQAIDTTKAYVNAGKTGIEKIKTGAGNIIDKFKPKNVTQTAGNVPLLTGGTGLEVYNPGRVQLMDVDGSFITDLPGNTSIVSQAGKKSSKIGNFASELVEKQKGLKDKVLKLVSDIVGSICGGVSKKFPKLSGQVGSITKQVTSIATKVLGDKRIFSKFSAKISNFFIELGAGAATVGILDVGLAAWDATTGFMEAAHLFGVHTDQVDITMRVISLVMKTVTKFSVVQILDILNDMAAEGLGINIKRYIATLVYKAIPNTDDAELQKNQAAMDNEVKAYNEENGTKLSKEAYLDKVSPTVATKILGNDWTKNFMGTFSKNQAAKFMNTDKDNLSFMDRTAYGVSHIAKSVTNFFGGDGDLNQKRIGDFYKNSKSVLTKDGARQNMGLNENAKVTMKDRFANIGITLANNIANLFRDPDEKRTNSEAMSAYTQKRNEKAQRKLDKAEAILADKNSNFFQKQFAKLSKSINQKKLGIETDKQRKNREKKQRSKSKRYIPKNTNRVSTEETFEMDQPDVYVNELYNGLRYMYMTGQISKEEYTKMSTAGDMSSSYYDKMINEGKDKSAGFGAGPTKSNKATKPAQKAVEIKNNADKEVNVDKLQKEVDKSLNNISKTMSKSVNNISKSFTKGLSKIIKSLEKDMKKVDKDISKGFNNTSNSFVKSFKKLIKEMEKVTSNNTSNSFVKSFKKLIKEMEKVTSKTTKNLDKKSKKEMDSFEKSNKNIIKQTTKLVETIGKKVSSVIDNIKGINLPSIKLPDFSNIFGNLFGNNNTTTTNNSSINSSSKNNSSKNSSDTSLVNKVLNFFNLGKGGQSTTATTPAPVTHNKTENVNNFTYYSQNDNRWGKKKLIGGETVADAGCGPTSLAMVMSQMHGKQITPDMIASMAPENLPGFSTPDLFPNIASKFNTNAHGVRNIKEVKEQLKQGRPVIISGKGSGSNNPYTKEGHIVVATGLDGDNIIINDPRGAGLSKPYSAEELARGFNLGYTFTKPGQEDEQFIPVPDTNEPAGAIGDNADLGKAGTSGGKVRLFDKVIQYARAFKGKLRYSMDSNVRNWINNGKLGADCSSFTQHVFKTVAGINIGANTGQQLTKGGTEIPISNAQPGDLILFKGTYNSSHPRGVSHVGIVSDNNGNMIDQGSSGAAPKERSYNSSYWKSKQLTAIRVLSNPNEMVDPTISNGNKAIGTVVATPSGIPDVTGGGYQSTDGTSETSVPQVNTMGAFDLMGNAFQNYAASVWNGKEVDLFATQSSTSPTNGNVNVNGREVKALFTAYYPENSKLQGGFYDAMGNKLDPAKMTCAAPKDVPFGTKIQIKGTGTEKDGQVYTVTDRGGAIKVRNGEYQFDLLMKDRSTAYGWGRKNGQAIIGDSAGSGLECEGPTCDLNVGKGPTYGYTGDYPDTMNNFTYYSQADPRWGGTKFDGTDLATAGCGPTASAMVMSQLTGRKYLPTTILNVGKDHIDSNGSKWSLFPYLAKQFKTGIKESVTSVTKIKDELSKGNPVILSGRNGNSGSPYTKSGHIITAVGMDGNNVLINDPRSPAHTKAYTKSQIESGLRGGWSFSKLAETTNENVPADGDLTSTTTGASNLGGETTNAMGAFDLMGNAFQNYAASIWNGKEVDLFATQTSSSGYDANAVPVELGDLSPDVLNKHLKNSLSNTGKAFFDTGLFATQTSSSGYDANAVPVELGDLSPDVLNKHLKNSLSNTGKAFFDTGVSSKVNPALAVAIANHETGYGTSNAVKNKNNPGGIMDPKSGHKTLKSFSTINEGVKYMVENLGRRIHKDGKNTIESLGAMYAPIGAANDPKGLNKHWVPNVKAMYKKIVGTDNVKVTTEGVNFNSAGKGGDSKLSKLSNTMNRQLSKKPTTKYAGKGGNVATSTPTKLSMPSKQLPTMKNSVSKLTQNNSILTVEKTSGNITESCIELINTIIAELKSINTNTANTVNAVNGIEIVPANASITQISNQNTNIEPTKQKYNGRVLPTGTNKGYDLAKRIASFA